MGFGVIGASRSRVVVVPALVAMAVALCAAPLPSQSERPSPWEDQTERPVLASADADTNDAASYRELGELHMRSDPELAARAFWWASRLEPADPLPLAVRARLYWQEHRGLAREISRGKAEPHELAEAERFDSLATLAMLLDPFVAFRREVSGSVLPALWVTDREMKKNPDAIGLRSHHAISRARPAPNARRDRLRQGTARCAGPVVRSARALIRRALLRHP